MYVQECVARQLLLAYGFPFLPFGVVSTLEEVKLFLHAFQVERAIFFPKKGGTIPLLGQGKAELLALVRDYLEKEEAPKVLVQEEGDFPQVGEIRYLLDYSASCYRAEGSWKGEFFSFSLPPEGGGLPPITEKFPESLTSLLEKARCAVFDWEGLFLGLHCVRKKSELCISRVEFYVDERACSTHKRIAELYAPSFQTVQERIAEQFDLDYTSLEGDIGCVVSGAGLGAALLHELKLGGGDASALLNVGRGISQDLLHTAFRILLSDPKTRGIFVCLLPGVFRGRFLVEELQGLLGESRLPVVVRFSESEELKGALREIFVRKSLDKCVQKIVGAVRR